MLFGTPIVNMVLDFYITLIIVYMATKFVVKNKRILSVILSLIFLLILTFVTGLFDFSISHRILKYLANWLPVAIVVIMAPDLRRSLENAWKADTKRDDIVMGSEKTKQSIVDAAMHLSSLSIGALITIEKHNTLDSYAEKAIMMNSMVSKEVLINIFSPNTPLHDGAVIIRGDEILCAGAYFILSDTQNFEKTMGSRHRAGLGISEISDSLTIIVSEETGNVSIAIDGIMLRINDREKLMEYINMFMK